MDNLGKLAIIGAGAMGSAFAGGLIDAGVVAARDVTLADVDRERLDKAQSELGVVVTSDNSTAVRDADVVLIAVKPAQVSAALTDMRLGIGSRQLIVSIAAGVKIDSIEAALPAGTAVIRAMPNTPCLIRAGAIGFSRGTAVSEDQTQLAERIFDAVGISFEVPEKLLDAVTGLSGSGPAYVYLMIEALSDGGVRMGLPRAVAMKLAAQTVLGAARMVVEKGEHPAMLKDQVASPGGTTIAGIEALEKAGFRSALIEAVKAATKRAEELG
jgi:pyrroline-5-carboxylate reductase